MAVRFAPSPTGTFHLGNLRTAWISRQWADALKLPWVVRFEDIDRPRIVYGAREKQLEDMKRLGLVPDILVEQSHFFDNHFDLFVKGIEDGVVYPCYCSRKEIVDALASAPHTPAQAYTGACRTLKNPPAYSRPNLAWRFKNVENDPKQDFVIARTEPPRAAGHPPSKESFVPAYHWACAIDDFNGHHQLLVRAWDLYESAPLQRSIQKWLEKTLGYVTPVTLPAIFHTSLVVSDDLTRLEKRTKRVTLDEVNTLGFSDAQVVEKFRASFHSKASEFAPGLLFGETKKQITLSDLGIKCTA